MSNIICLDIDDCVLPSDINYFGRTHDSLHILEINLKRLAMILEKYDMKVFITSSWYMLLSLDDGELGFKSDRDDYITLMGYGLMKKYIGDKIIGLSCGCRETDIQDLVDKGDKVVILDDWDLQHLQDKNEDCLFVNMSGFIDGNVGFMIHRF